VAGLRLSGIEAPMVIDGPVNGEIFLAYVVERENTHRWEKTADLLASWTAYAKQAGEEPGSGKRFSENMRRRGLTLSVG
jgi:hypothetical protein